MGVRIVQLTCLTMVSWWINFEWACQGTTCIFFGGLKLCTLAA